MGINQTVSIKGSVGTGGVNNPQDARTIQQQLNDQMRPPRVALKVDGKVGPKTRGMIADFQINVVGIQKPDSRIDPNGKTLRALNDPESESKWAKMSIAPPPPPPGNNVGSNLTPSEQQRLDAMLEEARKANLPAAADVLTELVTNPSYIPLAKKILNYQGSIQYFIEFLRGLQTMRSVGFTITEIVSLMRASDNIGHAFDLMRGLGRSSRLATMLKGLGKFATVLQVVATLFIAIEHFRNNRFGPGFAELYGTAMAAAVPWAGCINAMQEILFEMNPAFANSPYAKQMFRLLLALDPIGAGKTAVDVGYTFVQMFGQWLFEGKVSPNEMNSLLKRIQESPMKFWADIGDTMGKWLADKTGEWFWRTFLR